MYNAARFPLICVDLATTDLQRCNWKCNSSHSLSQQAGFVAKYGNLVRPGSGDGQECCSSGACCNNWEHRLVGRQMCSKNHASSSLTFPDLSPKLSKGMLRSPAFSETTEPIFHFQTISKRSKHDLLDHLPFQNLSGVQKVNVASTGQFHDVTGFLC